MTTAVTSSRPAVTVGVTAVCAAAYRIPTDSPEADGTLAWNDTTLIVVHAEGGGICGTG